MVFEYREEQQEMVLMNYWNRDGSRVEQQAFPLIGYSDPGGGNRAFCLDANGRYINGGSPVGGGEISWNFHQKLWKCKV